MKMFRNGYWQKLVILFDLLVQLAIIVLFCYYFLSGFLNSQWAFVFIIVIFLVDFGLMVYIVNSRSENEYKIVWLVFVGGIPFIGPVFYLLFAHKIRTKKQNQYLHSYFSLLRHDSSLPEVKAKLRKESESGYAICNFIEKSSDSDVFSNSKVEYFPLGDYAFPAILRELRAAKHFIYLEYFIVKPGEFWDDVLSILLEKKNLGVDVKIIYDDIGNLGATPIHYERKLRKLGLDVRVYSHIKPFLDIRMNNRDHRKIMVIDGHTAFTGGINLADEYINVGSKFGQWKDNCIMVKGKAVYGYTLLFLANYKTSFNHKYVVDFDAIAPEKNIDEAGGFPVSDGFVQPYGDLPYADYTVGEDAYISLLSKAKRYVYISTPYLLLDEKLRSAIQVAATSGVDVRLLVPGIPDKKAVYQLTQSNYGPLLEKGVRIYEYTPGFVHQKMFVSDDELAIVGTINLDYRSLYLHMENGTLLIGCHCIGGMKRDFVDSFALSHEVSLGEFNKRKKRKWLLWALLKLVGPLL